MDSLFQSFNQQVSMHNFAELSGCVFSWIEEQCKPGDLQVLKKRSIVFLLPFTMSSFQGPDLLNTETDREQRRREKSKPSGSGLPVVQIERIASAQKTRYDSNNRQETLKRIDIANSFFQRIIALTSHVCLSVRPSASVTFLFLFRL